MSYQQQQYSSPSSQIDSNLQFYSSNSNNNNQQQQQQNSFYSNRPSLDPGSRIDIAGSIGSGGGGGGGSSVGSGLHGISTFGSNGNSLGVQNWWNAFTPWTGLDGEPPLLEGKSNSTLIVQSSELGINFDHILQKSLTVLNPFSVVDVHIMDDADLAGPLVFCFIFATLLLVSGKPQFSYIYGVALVGSTSIYLLLNLMSTESNMDVYRVASVLGYCLLPMVLLSTLNLVISLDGAIGYTLSFLTILWCSYAASSIFSAVLRLTSQKFLVAYPVALFFLAFALLTIFDGKTVTVVVKSIK